MLLRLGKPKAWLPYRSTVFAAQPPDTHSQFNPAPSDRKRFEQPWFAAEVDDSA